MIGEERAVAALLRIEEAARITPGGLFAFVH
jgi:hypothetical protein